MTHSQNNTHPFLYIFLYSDIIKDFISQILFFYMIDNANENCIQLQSAMVSNLVQVETLQVTLNKAQ